MACVRVEAVKIVPQVGIARKEAAKVAPRIVLAPKCGHRIFLILWFGVGGSGTSENGTTKNAIWLL